MAAEPIILCFRPMDALLHAAMAVIFAMVAVAFASFHWPLWQQPWWMWLGIGLGGTIAAMLGRKALLSFRRRRASCISDDGWWFDAFFGGRSVGWGRISAMTLCKVNGRNLTMALNPPRPGPRKASRRGPNIQLPLDEKDLPDFLRRLDALAPPGIWRNWRWTDAHSQPVIDFFHVTTSN